MIYQVCSITMNLTYYVISIISIKFFQNVNFPSGVFALWLILKDFTSRNFFSPYLTEPWRPSKCSSTWPPLHRRVLCCFMLMAAQPSAVMKGQDCLLSWTRRQLPDGMFRTRLDLIIWCRRHFSPNLQLQTQKAAQACGGKGKKKERMKESKDCWL